MNKQQPFQNEKDKNILPYDPIVFVYSQTIGAPNLDSKKLDYEWQFKDILIPHFLNNYNHIFYVLFHIPSIYNWIRKIQSKERDLLNDYICQIQDRQKASNKTIYNLEKHNFINSIKSYIKKWQIVKLNFCSKIFVKDIIFSSNQCFHLLKKQVDCFQYNYNLVFKKLTCRQIECNECKSDQKVEAIIKQLPKLLILHEYFGENLTVINQNSKLEVIYEVSMLFKNQYIYIKAANKIWYEISLINQYSRVIGFQNIVNKNMVIVIYNQKKQSTFKSLRIAQPIQQLLNKYSKAQIQELRNQTIDYRDQPIIPSNQSIKIQKLSDVKSKNKKSLINLKLPQNVVIMKQNQTVKPYIDAVSPFLVKQKIKDEYQLNYDKGKLKKKKEKKSYIKPDFNQIHKKLKLADASKHQLQIQPKKYSQTPIKKQSSRKIKKIKKNKKYKVKVDEQQ